MSALRPPCGWSRAPAERRLCASRSPRAPANTARGGRPELKFGIVCLIATRGQPVLDTEVRIYTTRTGKVALYPRAARSPPGQPRGGGARSLSQTHLRRRAGPRPGTGPRGAAPSSGRGAPSSSRRGPGPSRSPPRAGDSTSVPPASAPGSGALEDVRRLQTDRSFRRAPRPLGGRS